MAKDKVKVINKGGPFGGAYFLAFIGAAVYFIQNSVGFWEFILSILKGLVWPAYLLHQAFVLMHV